MTSGIVRGAVRETERVHRPTFLEPRSAVPVTSPSVVDRDSAESERQRAAETQARLRDQAAELEALRERAWHEGLESGRQQAHAEAKASVARALGQLRALMGSMQQTFEQDRAAAQAALADLVFAAVARLLGDSLIDRRLVVSAVKATLASCDAWQDLVVEVHPQDAACIEAARAELPNAAVRSIRVVGSGAVDLGGCRVSGISGTVDARLEVQLATLRLRLDEVRRASPGSAP